MEQSWEICHLTALLTDSLGVGVRGSGDEPSRQICGLMSLLPLDEQTPRKAAKERPTAKLEHCWRVFRTEAVGAEKGVGVVEPLRLLCRLTALLTDSLDVEELPHQS